MLVDCDKCNGRFKLRVRKKRLDGKDEAICYTCKHCKHEYTAYYQNRKTERLKSDIRGMENAITRLPIEKRGNIQKKLEQARKELNKEMDRLKEKYARK